MKEQVLVEFSSMALATQFPINIVIGVRVKFVQWRQCCHRKQCVIINYSGSRILMNDLEGMDLLFEVIANSQTVGTQKFQAVSGIIYVCTYIRSEITFVYTRDCIYIIFMKSILVSKSKRIIARTI